MTILDRMLFISFIRAYVIVFSSLLSLYIVLDLFTNVDAFFENKENPSIRRPVVDIISHIGSYYGYRFFQYYDRLCEAIALLAAMFTIAWMQRSNELLPMLSAGVPTQRVLRPVLLGAIIAIALGIVNQELIIPRIASELIADRDDFEGTRKLYVQGTYDTSGVQIEGISATRNNRSVEMLFATLPEGGGYRLTHITARNAEYLPKTDPRFQELAPAGGDPEAIGGWLLTNSTPAEIPERSVDPTRLRQRDSGAYFLWVRDADFENTVRGTKTLAFLSTSTIFELLDRSEAGRMNGLAVMFHMRVVRPLVGVLLVIIGVSIILRDQTRHVLISAGLCLVLCALFFAAIYAGRALGTGDFISPAMAAWFPILIFGPIGIVLWDGMHT